MTGGAGRMASGPGDPARRFADLRTRVLSAVVMAAAGLGLVWAGGPWTMAFVAVVAAALMWEFRSVTLHRGGPCGADAAFLLAGVVGAAIFAETHSPAGALIWLGWSMLVAAVADLVTGRRAALAWGVAGCAYIGAAAVGLLYLRALEPHGLLTVLWLVAVVAASDIGGYFGGRLIGGPKLWPRVSPKKTWSGSLGGLAFAAVAGALLSLAAEATYAPAVAAVSAAIAVVAQAGDLAESSVKRHFGVKDSGRLLPGHGGAFDRFDGLAPAAAVAALFSWWRGESILVW